MPLRPARLAALAASTLVLLAACGGSPTPSSSPTGSPAGSPATSSPGTSSSAPEPSAATAALLLKVTSEGGFINPSATLAALPIVEVYDDGQILTPGPVDSIAPGPLVMPAQIRNVGAPGAAAIRTALQTAGLDQRAAGGRGVPGDWGTGFFAVTIEDQRTGTRLSGNGPGGPGLPGSHGSEDPG